MGPQQRLGARVVAQRADGQRLRDPGELFERGGDLRRREPVVPVPPVQLDGQQLALAEHGQVTAHRGVADPRDIGLGPPHLIAHGPTVRAHGENVSAPTAPTRS
ncbi:hypothetical protein [Actinomadura fibrosa]|uniref:Uncharacterized protein n=1 Tax=Actinomadura fibrosa TaxID=111802 RepID=A0ABW2Y0X7_9ACTN|nr:hypothetical protein [Actinomadura fibrosa]